MYQVYVKYHFPGGRVKHFPKATHFVNSQTLINLALCPAAPMKSPRAMAVAATMCVIPGSCQRRLRCTYSICEFMLGTKLLQRYKFRPLFCSLQLKIGFLSRIKARLTYLLSILLGKIRFLHGTRDSLSRAWSLSRKCY